MWILTDPLRFEAVRLQRQLAIQIAINFHGSQKNFFVQTAIWMPQFGCKCRKRGDLSVGFLPTILWRNIDPTMTSLDSLYISTRVNKHVGAKWSARAKKSRHFLLGRLISYLLWRTKFTLPFSRCFTPHQLAILSEKKKKLFQGTC